jgi:Cu+-exporting ATPase
MEIKVGVRVRGRETVLKILGMHCATCSLTVQRALLSVRGVRWAEASLASNEAKVVAGPELDYGELLKAVRRAGYDVYREAVYISVPGARLEDAAAVGRLQGLLQPSHGSAVCGVQAAGGEPAGYRRSFEEGRVKGWRDLR